MQITDLYKKYNLMPNLVTHQLRVGAIVRMIKDDRESVLTALVHDMGNLAKFKLSDPYWTAEQVRFREKYGSDPHIATIKILEECGLTQLAQNIEEEAALYRDILNIDDLSRVRLPSLLTLYGDSRVAISGVVSLEERIVDLETRYGQVRTDRIWGPKLEDYVQTLTPVAIREIKEQDVVPLFDELLTLEL